MNETYVSIARTIQSDPTLVLEDALPKWTSLGDDRGLLDAYRPELYAHLAIVADRVVSDAMDDRESYPPYGLNDGSGSIDDLNGKLKNLRVALKLCLDRRVDRTLADMRRSESSPIVSRLDDLVALFSRADESPRYQSLNNLVYAGFDTVSFETVNSIAAISRLALSENPNATKTELADIARRSSILIRRVASLSLCNLDTVTKRISRAGTSEEMLLDPIDRVLVLKQSDDGNLFVDFVEPIKNLRVPRSGYVRIGDLVEGYYKTLGCPALAKLGESPSAINRIWRWVVDIAEQDGSILNTDYFPY